MGSPDSGIAKIQEDLDQFYSGIETTLRESLVPFPNYDALSKTASASLKKLEAMQQVLWRVSAAVTEVKFKKITLRDLLREIKLAKAFDFQTAKPVLAELDHWVQKLRSLEELALHREQAVTHAIVVIRSIQSAGTSRRLFEE